MFLRSIVSIYCWLIATKTEKHSEASISVKVKIQYHCLESIPSKVNKWSLKTKRWTEKLVERRRSRRAKQTIENFARETYNRKFSQLQNDHGFEFRTCLCNYQAQEKFFPKLLLIGLVIRNFFVGREQMSALSFQSEADS